MKTPARIKLFLLCGLLIMVMAITLSACSAENALLEIQTENPETVNETTSGEYTKISAAEAKKMIDNEEVIILDVRTVEEFEEKHIAGALLIPEYEIAESAPYLLPDKDATILIYCRSGRRSEIASQILLEMGYRKVYDFGGLIDWPYETVSGN